MKRRVASGKGWMVVLFTVIVSVAFVANVMAGDLPKIDPTKAKTVIDPKEAAKDQLKSKAEEAVKSEVDPSKVEPPKAEYPKAELPKAEMPKAELPKVETPKMDTPKVDTPKVDTPKVEVPTSIPLKKE